MSHDHHPPETAFPSQTVGPFFHFALAADAGLGCLARPGCKGERLRLRFRVLDGDAAPVPDALLEIWHVDANGRYPTSRRDAFAGFGRLATDADGVCTFETIRPGIMLDAELVPYAPHVNIMLFARGLLRHLYTRVYFAGGVENDRDPFLMLVPSDRRETMMMQSAGAGLWSLDIHLQGPRETVFFDL